MQKKQHAKKRIGNSRPAEDHATLELSIQDLGRILKPLIVGDVVTGLGIARADSGGIAVHLKDIDAGRFVPSFDVTLVMTASLADPQTIVCQADMDGLTGRLLALLKSIGGMRWLLKNFADPDAFSVSDGGEILVHLDRLPEEMAEWLTERLTLTEVEVPEDGPVGVRISFRINRFASAEMDPDDAAPQRKRVSSDRPRFV